MCCEEEFLKGLHERGLRLTPQREMVLSSLHHLGEHPTVEELYARVQERTATVDVSTVYRTLELLEGLGLVAALDLGDGQHRYELLSVRPPHHHLLCRACHNLVTLPAEALEPLSEGLRSQHAFHLAPDHLVIRGLCGDCQASAQLLGPFEGQEVAG